MTCCNQQKGAAFICSLPSFYTPPSTRTRPHARTTMQTHTDPCTLSLSPLALLQVHFRRSGKGRGWRRKKPCYSQLLFSSTSGRGRLRARIKRVPSRNTQRFTNDLQLRHLWGCPVHVEIGMGVFPNQALLLTIWCVSEWSCSSAAVLTAGPPNPAERQLAWVLGFQQKRGHTKNFYRR